jgi:hypothetical protein
LVGDEEQTGLRSGILLREAKAKPAIAAHALFSRLAARSK